MKVKNKGYKGDGEFKNIKDAAIDALTPDAYSYDGALEKANAKIEKLQEMVANLVAVIYDKIEFEKSDVDQLTNILGYGYEVEE